MGLTVKLMVAISEEAKAGAYESMGGGRERGGCQCRR